MIKLIVTLALIAVASATTAAGPATTAAAATTAAMSPTCATVNPPTALNSLPGQPVTTTFTVTGNFDSTCTSVILSVVNVPTTVPTTTLATTTVATTTAATTTTGVTTTAAPMNTTTGATTTEATTLATSTGATTTSMATTTMATTTLAATTSSFFALTQPFINMSSTTTRQFFFTPTSVGPFQVTLQCTNPAFNATLGICGQFFSSAASNPVTFQFSGTIPADMAAFKQNFAQGVATGAGVSVLQVADIQITNTRRRAGFAVTVRMIGTLQSMDPANAINSVRAAAASGALNNALQAATGMATTGIVFDGQTIPVSPGTTINPGTPTPGAASSTTVFAAASLLIASVVALLF